MFEPTMVNIKRTRKQRVKPQQDRGKEMVAVLLESARRVLVAHGYAGLTSARIAETAGVSVGTLYHYFPTIGALAAQLLDKQVAMEVIELRQTLEGMRDQPIAAVVEAVVRNLGKIVMNSAAFHRALLTEAPDQGKSESWIEAEKQVIQWITTWVAGHREAQSLPQHELRAFLVVHFVQTSIDAAGAAGMLEKPGTLDEISRAAKAVLMGT